MTTIVRLKWPRGHIATGQELRDLDVATWQALDGFDGGTYIPLAGIVIAGAGVTVASKWVLSGGARVLVEGTPSSRVLFAEKSATDAFHYVAGDVAIARAILSPMDSAYAKVPSQVAVATIEGTIKSRAALARFFSPIRVHGQGTIEEVKLKFQVAHSIADGVPERLPRMRAVRIDAGGVVEALRASDATTDPDGFIEFTPRPTTGALYQASFAFQYLTYTCNQNKVVDKGRYTYWVEVIDDSSPNLNLENNANVWFEALVTHSNINILSQRQ